MVRTKHLRETIERIAAGDDVTVRTSRWKMIFFGGGSCLWLSLMALMLWAWSSPVLAVAFGLFPAAGWVLVVAECVSPTTLTFRQDLIETRMLIGRSRTLRLAEVREFFVFSLVRGVGSCAYRTLRPGPWLGISAFPQMLTIPPHDLAAALNRRLAHYPCVERDAYFQARMRNWNVEEAVAIKPDANAAYLP